MSDPASVTVAGIVAKVTDVQLQPSVSLRMQGMAQLKLTYAGTPMSVEYTSENDEIATVSASGVVSGVEYGATRILLTVTDYDGTVTTAYADVTVKNIPPSITLNPAATGVKIEADTATFTVTAAGSHNIYQWYKNTTSATNDGTVISGTENPSAQTAALVLPVSAAQNGIFYYCVVSNEGNPAVTSASAELTVYYPHTITSQPAAHTVLAGQTSVTFTVSASGGSPSGYTYQWYEKSAVGAAGVEVAGATQSSLTLQKSAITTARDGHLFYCVVSNGQYAVTSTTALLTAKAPVTITAQPQDLAIKSAYSHGDATFSVTTSGEGTLSYQWYRDTEPLSASGTSYSIAADEIDRAAKTLTGTRYSCKITQVYGESSYSVTTNDATLTIYWAPVIVEQPSDVGVVEGEAVMFSASVKEGNPSDLTYAWYRVDASGDIKVADTLSYTIPAGNVSTDLHGSRYYLEVSNGAEYYTVRSKTVTLTVCGIPAMPTITVTDVSGVSCGSGVWGTSPLTAEFGGSTLSGAGTFVYQYSTDMGATWVTADNIEWNTETAQTTLRVRAVNTWASRAMSPVAEYVIRYDSVAPVIGHVEVGDVDIRDGATLIMTGLEDAEPQSGLAGYHINATGEVPTLESFWYPLARTSATHIVTKDGTWYVWLLDNAGNITPSPYECEVLGLGAGTLSTSPLITELQTDISGYILGRTHYSGTDNTVHEYATYSIHGADVAGLQLRFTASPRDGYYLGGYVEVMGVQHPLCWGSSNAAYTSKRATAQTVIDSTVFSYSARNIPVVVYVSEYSAFASGVLTNKTNTQKASMTVSVDVSAPVVNISYDEFSGECTATAKDALAGLSRVMYQLSADGGSTYGPTRDYSAPFAITESCVVRVTATDRLNNQTEETSAPITVATESSKPTTGLPASVAAPADDTTSVYVYRTMRFNYVLVGAGKSN